MQKLLTVNEAAELLAITPRAVREKIGRRQIPFTRMGKLLRVPATQLEAYISALSGCTTEEALSRQHNPE